MQRIINILANEGFNPSGWIHDEEINGAWYGKIGSKVALIEDKYHYMLVNYGEVRKFKNTGREI